jgi:hypothetical protein
MTSKPRLPHRGQKNLKVLQNSAEDNIRIKQRQTGRRMKLFASFVEVFNTHLYLKDINRQEKGTVHKLQGSISDEVTAEVDLLSVVMRVNNKHT